ncbi:unnamed protein product [Urochloa humidicola]
MRLESIDARRRQVTISTEQAAGSPQGCSPLVDDMRNGENIEERVAEEDSDSDGDHEQESEANGDPYPQREADDDEVNDSDC